MGATHPGAAFDPGPPRGRSTPPPRPGPPSRPRPPPTTAFGPRRPPPPPPPPRRPRPPAHTRAPPPAARSTGVDHMAVVGDLNDSPDSAPLAPLLTGTDLCDVTVHPRFTRDGRPGTFGNGTAKDKIDYILLSPSLFSRVVAGGIHRKG